ncbi:AsnC family transcriptional regulator [Leucobacter allii]|uniref:AsnC family transcriptional regulator n=1 Tax=Leucobacter allii TaxID=2932247 RepID=A0ABY4FPU4_9MICO|nr:AsnC family transcriptional regulator [Leucobacter allii]UOQ58308.1 AsnC family transcriptional regulator [Leucobacter allii]
MPDTLDRADREICAALLRNGRAPWRLIAQATGIQERTVARRGTRLLDSGLVRVKGLSQPGLVNRGEGYLARIACAPAELRGVAAWLAKRDETLWVATLVGSSTVIAECYLRFEDRAGFIEEELAALPITHASFAYIDHYRRTVRGWHPNILRPEQLEQLGENESRALAATSRAGEGRPFDPDDVDLQIIELLSTDGRLSIDAIASAVGIAKPTVRKRIAVMQETDFLSIRAVVDPALLGFPLEALLTVHAPLAELDAVGIALAEHWRTRWAVQLPSERRAQALVTAESRFELHALLRAFEARLAPLGGRVEASPLLTHYKRSDVLLPAAEEPRTAHR